MSDGIIDGVGFHVELSALTEAARGIRDTVQSQTNFDLRRLCGPAEVYGHDGLHDALGALCNQWSNGLNLLAADAEAISRALDKSASAYRIVDDVNAEDLAIDPGVRVITGG